MMPRRPPKKWFYRMMKRVWKQHPNYSKSRVARIVAGIWYKKLTEGQRKKILKGAEVAVVAAVI